MWGPTFLQNANEDSLESEAVILCLCCAWAEDFDAATGAAGRRRAGFVSVAAGSDHRHEACAGAARAADRLALPGGHVRRGLQRWSRPAAAADPVDGGACDPQAHL